VISIRFQGLLFRDPVQLRTASHGWARATIGDEHSEVSVAASYLSDALGDFITGVETLFGTERSECIWEIEPGAFCWKFGREGSRCTVQVFRNDENAPVFSGEDSLLHFSSEVKSAVQKVLDERGEQGYLDKWGHPFPEKSYRKLAQLIDRERKNEQGKSPSTD
jgi:hypothetical protein